MELGFVETKGPRGGLGKVGIREKDLRGHGLEQRLGPGRPGHVDDRLGRHDQRRVSLPPGLGGFREIVQNGGIAKVAPGLVDDHQLDPGDLRRVVQRQPQALQQVKERRLAQVLMLGGTGQVDHLPVGEGELVSAGVVEDGAPGSVPVPAAHRSPHLSRQRVNEVGEGAPLGGERIEVLDPLSELVRVLRPFAPSAQLEQPSEPAGQEREGALSPGERKRAQLEAGFRAAVLGGQLQVSASEKPGEPAVGPSQIEDQNSRVVLKRLQEEEVEREALAGSGGSENQGVSDIAGEQVVVVGREPLGLQDGQRGFAKVTALRVAPGRAEDGRETSGGPRRYEDASDLPAPGLGRHPVEVDRELPVALPDHLGVVGGEDAPDVSVQALSLFGFAMQRQRKRQVAVADAVRFEFDERPSEPFGFGRRGRVLHRGARPLRLLHVRRHGIALREVMLLRGPDLPPGGVGGPRPPLQSDGQAGVQPVQIPEKIRLAPARRREQRIEDQGLSVQAQEPPFGFQFGNGQPPVHAAPGRPVPGRAGAVHEVRKNPAGFGGGENVDGGEIRHQRPGRIDQMPESFGGRLDGGVKIGGFVRVAPPPDPVPHVGNGPRGGGALPRLAQLGIVGPGQIDLQILDAPGKKLPSLVLGDSRDAVGSGGRGETQRPAEEIEIKPGLMVEAREHPAPALQHLIQLLRRPAVLDGRREPRDGDHFSGTGETGSIVREPSPVRDLLGQRAGGFVVRIAADLADHDRSRRCHGAPDHLPGS